jgi:hypothetical protein
VVDDGTYLFDQNGSHRKKPRGPPRENCIDRCIRSIGDRLGNKDPEGQHKPGRDRFVSQIRACLCVALLALLALVAGGVLFIVSVKKTQVRTEQLVFGAAVVTVPKARAVWTEAQARSVSRMRCRPIHENEILTGKADEGYLLSDLYASMCANVGARPMAAVELGPTVHRCAIAVPRSGDPNCTVWLNPKHEQPWYSMPAKRDVSIVSPMCPRSSVVRQMPVFARMAYLSTRGEVHSETVYEDAGIALLSAVAIAEGDVPC